MKTGRKSRFGEPSRSITTRLPVSVYNTLGEDPSTAIGDMVVAYKKIEPIIALGPQEIHGFPEWPLIRKIVLGVE